MMNFIFAHCFFFLRLHVELTTKDMCCFILLLCFHGFQSDDTSTLTKQWLVYFFPQLPLLCVPFHLLVIPSLSFSQRAWLCCDMAFCECHLPCWCSLSRHQANSAAISLVLTGQSGASRRKPPCSWKKLKCRFADCSPSCDSRSFFCPHPPLG